SGEHGDANVRSLQLLPIEWDGTWLDGLEPVASVLCGAGAAISGEGWIQRRRPLICRMVVAAMRIRLPDFDHRIGYWHPVAIDNAPLDANALTGRLRPGQHITTGILTQESRCEEWTHCLRTGQGNCRHALALPDASNSPDSLVSPVSDDSNGVAYGPRTTMFQR